jgi:hypothetical protein
VVIHRPGLTLLSFATVAYSFRIPCAERSPSEASIVRFDDRQVAETELARVQSYVANARLREVG